ncbi:phage integrase, partial [Klebsiella pneumoniae]
KLYKVNDREGLYVGVRLENGIYGHSRFCNTDFDDKLACLNLSGV